MRGASANGSYGAHQYNSQRSGYGSQSEYAMPATQQSFGSMSLTDSQPAFDSQQGAFQTQGYGSQSQGYGYDSQQQGYYGAPQMAFSQGDSQDFALTSSQEELYRYGEVWSGPQGSRPS